MSVRTLLIPALLAFATSGSAASPRDASLERFSIVAVAPVTTTLYVANVTLTVPQFIRHGGVYESTYTAKIFPYFFWNEEGRLRIIVSDDTLRRFGHGESFTFSGTAIRSDGTARKVTGEVTPGDSATGKIRVRVFVTRHLSLAFDTTYRLPKMTSR